MKGFEKHNPTTTKLKDLIVKANVIGAWMDNPKMASAKERQAKLPQWQRLVREITSLERVLKIPQQELTITIFIKNERN